MQSYAERIRMAVPAIEVVVSARDADPYTFV